MSASWDSTAEAEEGVSFHLRDCDLAELDVVMGSSGIHT